MSVSNSVLNEITKISHNYFCYCCGKSYKKRETLNRHIILCELIDKAKSKNNSSSSNEESEIDELPSQKQMYKMIVELSLKYKILEEKMERAQIWIDKKKKKINVVDWLNDNIIPEYNFIELSENKIQVEDEDIEFLLQNTFIDTFLQVLIKQMGVFKINDNNSPIKSFIQNHNKIYILNEDKRFEELSREKLVVFCKKIHFKIVKELTEWKKRKGDSVDECEKMSIKYNNAILKVMGVDFKQEATIGKYKTLLFNRFKLDMKSIVEYEFQF
jgi:hypothetical protein